MSSVNPVTPAAPTSVVESLRGSPRRRRKERAVHVVFFGAATMSVLISVGIVYSLVGNAIDFLQSVDLSQLWTTGYFPRRGLFDLKTLFVGSLLVTGIALLVAGPVGLGAAIYLSEYASPRMRRSLKPILEVLAGIPSVVIGFFALTWIAPNIVQRLFSDAGTFSLAAAGIGVGILIIPIIASVAEDAMRAVPISLREASYGLGARKITTSVRVVLPAAVSGIVAAFILGISRAIGETLVVALAAGGSGGSTFTTDITGPGQTVTAAIASLSFGSDQPAGDGAAFQSLYFLGIILFIFTLLLNLAGDVFVRRTRQRY